MNHRTRLAAQPATGPAGQHGSTGTNTGFELALQNGPRKTASAHRSSDPYNSSGSFDRTQNWARVGKR